MPDATSIQTALTADVTAGLTAFGLTGEALVAFVPSVVQTALATLGDEATDDEIEAAATAAVAEWTATPRSVKRRDTVAGEAAQDTEAARLVAAYGPSVLQLSAVKRLSLLRKLEASGGASRSTSAKPQSLSPSLSDMQKIHPDWAAFAPHRKLALVNAEIGRRAALARNAA